VSEFNACEPWNTTYDGVISMSDLGDRVDALEVHVLGVDKENPGILMRLDRQEILIERMISLMRYVLAGGGLAAFWQVMEFARAIGSK